MPHVLVKLWPDKSEAQKHRLAERITKDVMDVFGYGADSIFVAMEDIDAEDRAEKVYRPGILAEPHTLYKKPEYTIRDMPQRRKQRS